MTFYKISFPTFNDWGRRRKQFAKKPEEIMGFCDKRSSVGFLEGIVGFFLDDAAVALIKSQRLSEIGFILLK